MGIHTEKRLKAVAFLCLAMVLAVSSDTISKYLSGRYPVHEFGTLRFGVTIPIGLAVAWTALMRAQSGLRDWQPLLLRAGLTTVGNLLFMMAAATITLADGVAIYFTMPFFVAGIVPYLLGEKVPLIRWIVIAVGFGGVLVMTRPGTSVFQPETFLALGCAFLYGLGQALTRKIDPRLPASVTALWQSIFMALFYACLGILFATMDMGATGNKSIDFLTRSWISPTWPDLALIIFSGVLSSLQLPLVVYAYKHADASFIAPFEYTAMLWAVLLGMAVFGDIPDALTITGALIVIIAGLFMVRFDRDTPLP